MFLDNLKGTDIVCRVLNKTELTETQLRLVQQMRISKATGCWNWLGTNHGTGYGVLSVRGRRTLAHRAAWEAFRGPIPDGLEVDHLCQNRGCINPDHLEPVTKAENHARYLKTLPSEISDSRRSILSLHEEGLTPRQIARELDLSVQRIYQQLAKLGLKPNPRVEGATA